MSQLPSGKQVPSAKVIARNLESENPTWKVSEKKVAKIVKKEHKKRKHEAEGTVLTVDDASVSSSMSSASAKARRALSKAGKALHKIVPHHKKKKKEEKLKTEPAPEGSGANLLPSMDDAADDVDVFSETIGTNNEVFTDDKNEEAEKPCWGLGCTIS